MSHMRDPHGPSRTGGVYDWPELRTLRPLPPSPRQQHKPDVALLPQAAGVVLEEEAVEEEPPSPPSVPLPAKSSSDTNDVAAVPSKLPVHAKRPVRSRLLMGAPSEPDGRHAPGPWQWFFAAPKQQPKPKPARPSVTSLARPTMVDFSQRLREAIARKNQAAKMLADATIEIIHLHRASLRRFLTQSDPRSVPQETASSVVNVVAAFLRAVSSLHESHRRRRRVPHGCITTTQQSAEATVVPLQERRRLAVPLRMDVSPLTDNKNAVESTTTTEADDDDRGERLDGRAVTHMIDLFDAMYDAETFNLTDIPTPPRHHAGCAAPTAAVLPDLGGTTGSLAFDADRASATQDALYRELNALDGGQSSTAASPVVVCSPL